MSEFTKKDIVKISGLSPRLVQFYTEEGLVTPEVDPGKGRGRFRKYSKKNLRAFVLIKYLAKFGVVLEILQVIMSELPLSAALERDTRDLDGQYYLRIMRSPDGQLIMSSSILGYKPDAEEAVLKVKDLKSFPMVLTIDLNSLFSVLDDL